MISVVIPAHDEEAVIGRCLAALLDGADSNALDVVVVCNGCTDQTAPVARSFGSAVRVFETEVASKPHALNLGDREARGFPRFYVDADVVIPYRSVVRVAREMNERRLLGAAPRLEFDLNGRSWAVRSYYATWSRLPYAREGLIGSGVYALSEEGRSRFADFPDTFAEDTFVKFLFDETERACVDSVSFVVTPPEDLRGLLRIQARRMIGNREVQGLLPVQARSGTRRQRQALLGMARDPRSWGPAAVYGFVRVGARAYDLSRRLADRPREWVRDETSR